MVPKKYKTLLYQLIQIAEHGNDYEGPLTEKEMLEVGALIADIQNNLGEMNDGLLNKLGLHYHGKIFIMYNTIGKTVRESKFGKDTLKPSPEQIVIGYDEWDKVERTVRYRQDSNRFFVHPYNGAVYPLGRMHQWRPIS